MFFFCFCFEQVEQKKWWCLTNTQWMATLQYRLSLIKWRWPCLVCTELPFSSSMPVSLLPPVNTSLQWIFKTCYKKPVAHLGSHHSSGAVWELRWPSWAVRPNEASGFRGRKAILDHALALVSACPEYVNWHVRTLSDTTCLRVTCEDIKRHYLP